MKTLPFPAKPRDMRKAPRFSRLMRISEIMPFAKALLQPAQQQAA